MKIFLNGVETDCFEDLTISQLIHRHGLSPETVLVERNGTAMHRREWRAHTLQENDRIEILQVAAGG
jgi:thiamine biosynthesis protein ThiS